MPTAFPPFERDEPQGRVAGTLVCLSGLNSGSYLFTGARAALPNWRIMRFNTPGVPGTTMPLPFTAASYAKQVATFLQGVPMAQPLVVLGHSLGGYAAQELARLGTPAIQRLILVSTGRGQPDTTRDLALLQRASGQSFWEFSRAIGSNPAQAMQPLFGPRWTEQNPAAYQHFLQQRQAYLPDKTATLAQISAGGGFSSVRWAHTLNCPTLVLHGTADVLISPNSGRTLAAAIPNARYMPLLDVGHFPMLEHPQFWEYVGTFAGGTALGEPVTATENWLHKLKAYFTREG